eukprot:INCI241.1.p1 GENE.INCI241.1~~INCI241.1.p1  ORF type:complete len:760 (+),score=98.88 INCI241.1:595-2874(+)
MASKAYLTMYNALCVGGWSSVAYTAVRCLRGEITAAPWEAFGPTLMVVQTAAILEIFHSMFRLVRSPMSAAIIQVASRVLLLWPYTAKSPNAQKHWSLYLMVLSWCLVEVVRYVFYGLKALDITVPKPLLWLRYSLFIVLYPSGITGELLQIVSSLTDLSPLAVRFAIFQLALYIPGSPYMIRNMWRMRRRAFGAYAKALHPPAPRPANGLSWPVRDADTGAPKTTTTNVAIWEAAVRAANAEKGDAIARDAKKWRFKYEKHVLENVKEGMKSAQKALQIARAGLDEAYNQFTFVRDGEEMPLRKAMSDIKGSFKTHFIRGEASKPTSQTYTVAYRDQSDGKARQPKVGRDDLSGKELVEQCKKWASNGVVEPDCAAAIAAVVENQDEWCDLSDVWFVILGATSAMGPIHVLLKHGANVVACDIQSRGPPGGGDGPWRGPWENLIKWARASCGTLTLPVPEDTNLDGISDAALAKVAGCNLLTQTPEIANWLVQLHPDRQFVIGNYTYLDGGLHVLLSIACDAIIARLAAERSQKTMACFLCTPTDDHVVPADVVDAVKSNQKRSPLWQKIVRAIIPRKHTLRSNVPVSEGSLHCVRAISMVQGPNYALAKRLQHWRAMILHTEGHAVSSNVAPSTRTISVVSNKMIGVAYNGMPAFKPMEVMWQETSNAVMGALLIHDIRNPGGVARHGVKLSNPLELFSKNSFHGGVWRCGYTLESIGLWSIVYALRAQVFTGVAALGGVVGFVAAGPDVGSILGLK